MAYRPYTLEEKREYAKKFTKKERVAYRKGKRVGFCNGVHSSNIKHKSSDKSFATQRTYSNEDIMKLFDNLKDIKW